MSFLSCCGLFFIFLPVLQVHKGAPDPDLGVHHFFLIVFFYLGYRYMKACQILIQALRYVLHCFVIPDPDPGVEVSPSLFCYARS